MRFLIGLCAGGLLTAAALLDPAERAAALDGARAHLADVVDAVRGRLDAREADRGGEGVEVGTAIDEPALPAPVVDRTSVPDAGSAAPGDAQPVAATPPRAGAVDGEGTTPPAPAPDPVSAAGTARAVEAVWIPFRSEMSATGFAERLGRALDHPFDVRREGPGSYQVIFPYDDPAEREALLARVAVVTGTPHTGARK